MKHIAPPEPGFYEDLISYALQEDLAWGDVTTDNLDLPPYPIQAELLAKEQGILAGWPIFIRVFQYVDDNVSPDDFNTNYEDGDEFNKGDIIATFTLQPATLLKGERVALNFLTHLSGIATMTNRFVKLAGPEGPAIADTRKTIPGLRALQKYAVRVGGGMNHRLSLSHAVMIKNNHIALAGGIKEAVKRVRQGIGHTVKVEVEASDISEVIEAVESGADIIMLDNFSPEQARKASQAVKGKVTLELSGGIDENNIQDYLFVGGDIISIGELTHSAKALDLAVHISA